MTSGPTYTKGQIIRYLDRINCSPSIELPANLDNLRKLVAGHLDAIPFENLSIHYSTHRSITVDKDFVFDKFVNQRKGGYCMEQNRAFATLLRSLGYELYTVGARVWQDANRGFTSLSHMAIILTLDEVDYLVDVGFGGNGLTAPLAIYDGDLIRTPIKGVLPEEHRVVKATIPGAAKRHKSWLLQHRRDPEAEWETAYMFEKDFEFFEGDYEMYVLLNANKNEYGDFNTL